jgi:hypothetical protein
MPDQPNLLDKEGKSQNGRKKRRKEASSINRKWQMCEGREGEGG